NGSTDPFWQKESQYILVECKNWSKHVGVKEVRDLWAKMEGRYGRCRLGFLVAAGGIADPARALQLRKAERDMLVVFLGPGDLDELIRRTDRNEALKEMHRHAVVAAAGRGDQDDVLAPRS